MAVAVSTRARCAAGTVSLSVIFAILSMQVPGGSQVKGHPDREPLKDMTAKEQAEITKDFEEFWLPIVKETGATVLDINLEQVKRELYDWHTTMDEVSKVYCEITGNQLSYPNYPAVSVLAVYHDNLEHDINEAVSEALDEATETYEGEIALLKKQLATLRRQLRCKRKKK